MGPKGITFSGATFTVPETHDMVKTLFDPSVRKSYFEMVILALLGANGLVFWLVKDNATRIDIFIGLYLFWRFSYNFGIGYLLNLQSNHHKLVNWATSLNAFDPENQSLVSRLVRSEISAQMGPLYDISKYPVDFNTWLIFRKVVDLILMLDFTTFVGVVVTCAMDHEFQSINTSQQPAWMVFSRFLVGAGLILFNLWVKVDAHNIIKDYAWYWGDFFFRQINNEDLIFDGVFEMFPHPMYSVGYAGYYGFALIAKSYRVLVVAVFGHFLQMIFLHYIENPHIDKLYGPSGNEADNQKIMKIKDLKNFDNLKPLVGLYNFTWLRANDLLMLIMVTTYSVVIPAFASLIVGSAQIGGVTFNIARCMFTITVAIKVFESLSINIFLVLQSHYKLFTKSYLANDIPIEKSLGNWAIIYNGLITWTYASFAGLNVFHYITGMEHSGFLFQDYFYLRLFIGALLVLTQVWINSSIIDLIGYFGWFYGDFFLPTSPQRSHLTKAGVYRYLNNPEQLFGVCGVMGVTIIAPSVENFVCCFLWVANNFFRINFIEKVHMIKIYGESEVLQDSGVTKTFKKQLIPDVILRRLSSNEESPSFGRNRSKSHLVTGITDTLETFVKELRHSNAKLSRQNLMELSQNLYFDNSDYQITIDNLTKLDEKMPKYTTIGSPIVVTWKCPETHSDKDWIGLYRVVQTTYSRSKTLISSSGRWTPVDSAHGSYTFSGSKLFWEEGIYEFRYHLDGKHEVAFISEPFEIRAPRIEVPDTILESAEFAEQLKVVVFDAVTTEKIPSIESPICDTVQKSQHVLETYRRLAKLISTSTGITISSNFLFNAGTENELSVHQLSKKLIHIQKVLEDLSPVSIAEKKTQ